STERKSHVMDLVFDEGLALFAGLNVVPKTTYLDTYSHRFSPKMNEKLRKLDRRPAAEELAEGRKLQSGFPLDSVLRGGRVCGASLPVEAQPEPEVDSGFSGSGCRKPRVLLLPSRSAQARTSRCGFGFRQVLEDRPWRVAARIGLRLQADYLRQSEPAEPDGHHLHDPAPTITGDL